jgi:hypothetical protein
MLGDVELLSDFADGAERIRRLVQMPAPSQLIWFVKTLYWSRQSMIRKSGYRLSLATNAERVCAKIMLKSKR